MYITYTPAIGADAVTKKLGNLGMTSYVQGHPSSRDVVAEFDVSNCNKISFSCRTNGNALWFMASNTSTTTSNSGTSLGYYTSPTEETKEYDVSAYKYFRIEMLGAGIASNIIFS